MIFDNLTADVLRQKAEWGANTGKRDAVGSFEEEHRRLASFNNTIFCERKVLQQQISAQRETYSEKIVSARGKSLLADYEEACQVAVAGLKEEVHVLVDGKRRKITEMLATPPTEAQTHLLTVLAMRGEELDSAEITMILPTLFGNWQAMKTLAAIAGQSGNRVFLPENLDLRTLTENLDKAEEFLLLACENVGKPFNEMSLRLQAFFTRDEKGKWEILDPFYQQYVDVLDSVPQLQDITVKKTVLTEADRAQLDFIFRDVRDLSPDDPGDSEKILGAVKTAIQTQLVNSDTLRLSPYWQFVDEALGIIAEEKAKQEAAENGSEEKPKEEPNNE